MTDFALSNSNIRLGGYWQGPLSVSGRSVYSQNTTGGIIDIAFTLDASAGSTDVSFPFVFVGNTSPCSVIVDGGAPTTPTLPGSGDYESIPLAAGLAPGAHTIHVTILGGVAWFHDQTTSLRFTGAIPTLTMPAGFSTKCYAVPANGASNSLANAYSRANAGHYSIDANLSELGNLNQIVLFTAHRFGCYRFKTTVGTGTLDIRVLQWGDGGQYVVRLDDGADGVVNTFDSDTAWSWVTIASGVDATVAHTISIYMDTICILSEVMIVGGGTADFDTSATFLTKRRLVIYGDSYTEPTPASSLINYGHYLGQLLGSALDSTDYEVLSKGIGGTAVANSISGSLAGETRTGDVTGFSPQADLCVVLYGYNDTAETGPQFQVAEWNMLNALTTNGPSTQYLVPSTPPRSDNHDLITTPIVADICTGAHSDGSGHTLTAPQIAKILYVDLGPANLAGAGHNDFTTNYLVDEVHPNKAGNLILANRINAIYQASLDTTPPSVPSGLASAVSNLVKLLSWTPSTDDLALQAALVYNIYEDGGSSPIGTTAAGVASYSVSKPVGDTHTYRVDAQDVGGNKSAKSDALSVSFDATATALSLSIGVDGSGHPVLTWVEDPDAVHYLVLRSATAQGDPARIAVVAAPTLTYTDTGGSSGDYYAIVSTRG